MSSLKDQIINASNTGAIFRQRSPFPLILAISMLVSSVFGASVIILMASFKSVETKTTKQTLERVLSIVEDDLEDLQTTAADYATWDDTYEYMARPNSRYVSSNYTSQTFESIDIDAIALYNTDAKVVLSRRYDAASGRVISLAPDWFYSLSMCPAQGRGSRLLRRCSGLQLDRQELMMTAIVPILPSDRTAPSRGMLLMGRHLNATRIERLGQLTYSKIQIYPFTQGTFPAELASVRRKLESGFAMVVSPDNWQSISGYAVLSDLRHQPIALIRVTLPRTIFQQGMISVFYLAISLTAMGTLLGGVTWFLLQKLRQYIQERDRIQQELLQEKELASITLHAIGDGVITIDASGNVLSMNPVAELMTGWHIVEAHGSPLSSILTIVDEETHEVVETPVERSLQDGQRLMVLNSRSLLISKQGEEFAIDTSVAPIRAQTDEIVGAVLVFRDVSQMRHLTRQLAWRANYDALTGLINRSEFEEQLEQAIATAQTQNQEHAMCFLDLDRFKIVNDTCGHAAGDELLRQISALLLQKVRKTDVVARLGGDEFAILLYQCPVGQANYLAQTICAGVAEYRFLWGDHSFTVGISIGLVVIRGDNTQLEDVLKQADTACYIAKQQGRGQVYINPSGSNQSAESAGQIDWVLQVKNALEADRFHLVYQEIRALNPDLPPTSFCEVLLRMADDRGALLPPGSFLPIAERYNLSAALDRWVIHRLFVELNHHKSLLSPTAEHPYLFAVNLSAASINDDEFISFLQEQMETHSVPPHILCIEISETVAIANLSQMTRIVQALKALGCRIALDDFGSSIGAFDYLRTLPVDFLKIDGDVIKSVLDDSVAREIVGSITRIGHALELTIIAECVSSEAIFQEVQTLGIDYAQGYTISLPGPLEDTIHQGFFPG